MFPQNHPPPTFLTAAWRWLAVLNFDIDPGVLQPYVPRGTELDLWQGRALVSLVGFRFLETRLRGWPVPLHQQFSEVNLRFYVRRPVGGGWRRGVVFLREVVARPIVACVANWVYRENYVCRPLRHDIRIPDSPDSVGCLRYAWRDHGQWMSLQVELRGSPGPLIPGSEAEFVLEHYWGYSRWSDNSTLEYQVEHPSWRTWPATAAEFVGDGSRLYGDQIAAALRRPPCSAFVAEGSAVTVREGRLLE
uniref:DUF2071 domain-containing protein n=1 Tax=Schlesneria paludicola TaxID=360056 RepID=A0A7C2NWE4_9PLAN